MRQRSRHKESQGQWMIFGVFVFLILCSWMYVDSQKAAKAKHERETKQKMASPKTMGNAMEKANAAKNYIKGFLDNPLGLTPEKKQLKVQPSQQPQVNTYVPQVSDGKDFYNEAK